MIAGEHTSWYQVLDRKYRKNGKGHPFSTLHLTVPYPYGTHNRVLHDNIHFKKKKIQPPLIKTHGRQEAMLPLYLYKF
jgi:predicted transcriptional regulator